MAAALWSLNNYYLISLTMWVDYQRDRSVKNTSRPTQRMSFQWRANVVRRGPPLKQHSMSSVIVVMWFVLTFSAAGMLVWRHDYRRRHWGHNDDETTILALRMWIRREIINPEPGWPFQRVTIALKGVYTARVRNAGAPAIQKHKLPARTEADRNPTARLTAAMHWLPSNAPWLLQGFLRCQKLLLLL